MTPIEQTLVSFPMAAVLGLVFGMGACTLACLPYLGPVFLASDGGVRRSWRILLPFSLGRLGGYAALATAAGALGEYLGGQIAEAAQVRALIGVAAILIGLALWQRRTGAPTCHGGAAGRNDERPLQRVESAATLPGRGRPLLPGGLLLLGAGMTLTPCAPLGTVLFSAAVSASPWHGLLLGLGFGLGAIFIPSLVYGIGAAWIGARLREQLQHHRVTATRLSAALLVLTGVGNLLR
ncbi:MAG: sulfite exporter TauE/SafE family protein [Gammaproteobacteria bacterium]|nr:sulfite exporter TauE/SafE family protein [Gammaproteobacteria bacterium]